MDKEELKKNVEKNTADEELNTQSKENDNADQANEEKNLESEKKEIEKLTPEEELETLKDKLARTFAEMENQRRRFEKERDDAYEYGGYSFAKEALNLLDKWVEHRREIANIYNNNLKHVKGVRLTIPPNNIYHSYYKY